MSNRLLTNLLKTFSSFKLKDHVTPVDFVQNYIKDDKNNKKSKIASHLLDLCEKESLLDDIAQEFIKFCKVKLYNNEEMKVFIYFIIFAMDEDSYKQLFNRDIDYLIPLMEFLITDSNMSMFTTICCRYFDNNFILENIMNPLIKRIPLIQATKASLEENEANRVAKGKLTVPKEFEFHTQVRVPPPPVNTPAVVSAFKFKEIQKSTVKKTTNFNKIHMNKIFDKDSEKSTRKTKQHLRDVSQSMQRLAKPKKLFTECETSKIPAFKPAPCPTKKDVEIKGNLTSTLREASHLLRAQENEINKLDEILKGGCNLQNIIELEKTERLYREQKEIENIQKKHLQGLLTHEEAILARKKIVEDNKTKANDLKNQKIEMALKLERWKEEEQEKIKAQVERCQQIKINVKESEKRIQDEKMNQVKIQQYETRQLLKKACEEKEKELLRKIELIKEIKTMHEITMKLNSQKEFDPTETPNLGLLSEMSIAELQERLHLTKIRMQDELQEKRNAIMNKKIEQQVMVEKMRKFVANNKIRLKPKPVQMFNSKKIEMNPELIQLKKLLEEKRMLRMKAS